MSCSQGTRELLNPDVPGSPTIFSGLDRGQTSLQAEKNHHKLWFSGIPAGKTESS